MTIDDKIRDEKLQCNIKEKLQKYQHHHLEKLININSLLAKKILPTGQSVIIEQARYFFAFRKSFRQTNKND